MCANPHSFMRILILFVFFAILLSFMGLISQVEVKATKYSETLNCKENLECTSIFEVPKGSKATLTISVASSKHVDFGLTDPNGKNVILSGGAFPDTSGISQVFTRVFTSNVNGDYTFYFNPEPQSFRATLTVVVEDSQPTNIQNIPAASQPKFGGCLIATATYGSELSPQVQHLRELRDNKLLHTKAGSAFIEGFNRVYYSFSPYIADYERENPFFKEGVKLTITPLISSLSILNHVNLDTEEEVLGYGISLIMLNVGMYVGIPVAIVIGIRRLD